MNWSGGVLPLLKPPGPSSHQVVASVRHGLGRRWRVGHTGTLDPGAAGVLPMCVGSATRLAQYLQIPHKAYRFELVLGQATDTGDGTGRMVGGADASGLRREQVEAALRGFVGDIRQQAPLHSARHVAGKRLYAYARAGESPPLPEIAVHVQRLALLGWVPGHPARGLCDVLCGSGTYVRSLCADIGAALGVGGHMGHLVRYSAGGIRAEQCITLEEFDTTLQDGGWVDRCLSPAEALAFLPTLTIDPAEAVALRHGRAPGRRRAAPGDAPGLVRVLDDRDELLAVARRSIAAGTATCTLETVLA